jgi:hypothetical protein
MVLHILIAYQPPPGWNSHKGKEPRLREELPKKEQYLLPKEGQYSRNNLEKAKEAMRLQGMMGNPTEREFTGMVSETLITDCPVTVRDIDNANRIIRPNLINLRGKMTRTKPDCVRVKYVEITQILSNYIRM